MGIIGSFGVDWAGFHSFFFGYWTVALVGRTRKESRGQGWFGGIGWEACIAWGIPGTTWSRVNPIVKLYIFTCPSGYCCWRSREQMQWLKLRHA